MRYLLALTCILVALLVTAPAGVLGAGGPAPDAAPRVAAQEPPETPTPPAPADPSQIFTIQLTQDGHAEWTVESRFVIRDDADAAAFTDFGEAVVDGDVETTIGPDLFERYASVASSSTDREMHVENATWGAPRIESVDGSDSDHDVGVLTFSFRWTNFADQRDDGNKLAIGEAFRAGDDTWFRTLDEGQRLVIVRRSNYGYDQVDRAPTNGNLVWEGPHEFDASEFDVVYLQGANPPGPIDWPLLAYVLAAAVAVVLVGLGAYLYRRPRTGEGGPSPSLEGPVASIHAAVESARSALVEADGGRGPDAGDSGPDSADGSTSFDESSLEDSSAAAAVGEGVVSDEADAAREDEEAEEDDVEEDDVDVTLLSDEERVHRLLRGNGGRMKQAMIVKETGWSNAKVSQLLSKMDDDGEIEKLRIGRENLITLPEVDPTEID